MSDEISNLHAMESLRAAGFEVEPIAVDQNVKRADLRARYGQEEYIIEAKHKDESRQWIEFVEHADYEDVHNMSRSVVPWNAIASVIEGAAVQLAATPANIGAFRLLWIVSLHEDDEFVMECIKGRLFGFETVAVMEDGFKTKPCFYYNYSDFRRYPELDGAILSVRKGSKLCVNSFSPRLAEFTRSHLYSQFKTLGSVCDPVVSEDRGAAFLIGGDFTGKPGTKDSWAYLRRKYGVRTTVMRRAQFDGRFTIPSHSPTGKR